MHTEETNPVVAVPARTALPPPGSGTSRLFGWLFRFISKLMLSLLILLAVYVTGGRLVMGVLTYQADAVAGQLSEALDMPVSIAALNGSWSWFSPTLEVQHTHRAGSAELSLDPFKSLIEGQMVVTRILVNGLDIAVQQNANGGWSLAGLAGGQPDAERRLQHFILNTKLITLVESRITIKPLDSAEHTVDSLALVLENADNRHRLEAQLRVNGQASPANLVLTMEGQPGEDFNASLFTAVSGLDVKPFIASVLPAGWAWETVNTSANLWAEIDETGLQSVSGKFTDVQVLATEEAGDHSIDLQQGTVSLTLNRTAANTADANGWSLALQDITLAWQQTAWTVPAIQLHIPEGGAGELIVQASQLDAAMLAQIVNAAVPLPSRAASALQTLSPRGMLENVTLKTTLDGTYPGGFLLRSNLRDVAVDAWQGAPAGSGINGFLQADNHSGFVELASDDFTIRLPLLFSEAWHYDHINARISWLLDNGDVRIQSSIIDLANNLLKGRVQFELYNTRNTRNGCGCPSRLPADDACLARNHDLARVGANGRTAQQQWFHHSNLNCQGCPTCRQNHGVVVQHRKWPP